MNPVAVVATEEEALAAEHISKGPNIILSADEERIIRLYPGATVIPDRKSVV